MKHPTEPRRVLEGRKIADVLYAIVQLPISEQEITFYQFWREFVRDEEPVTNDELQHWLGCSREALIKRLSRMRQDLRELLKR